MMLACLKGGREGRGGREGGRNSDENMMWVVTLRQQCKEGYTLLFSGGEEEGGGGGEGGGEGLRRRVREE